ncbi:MAG TPA: hypothetical protein DFS52_31835 [Myxococcales bacterium]|nr:hypothetical protein [Myxococcales bacterium]
MAPLPDGSRSASIARPDGPFLARLWKPDGARVAAVFVGPSDYHPVFAHLGKHLMQLGIASLVVAASPPTAEPSRRAARSLLWLRGVGKPVLAGAGPCAMSALACARQLDAEAVALFSSSESSDPELFEFPARQPLCARSPRTWQRRVCRGSPARSAIRWSPQDRTLPRRALIAVFFDGLASSS